MLRPIFDQKSRRDGKVGPELERALRWWLAVLRERIREKRKWQQDFPQALHLFCDARGSPPHLAAVLFDGHQCLFTQMAPPEQTLAQFKRRSDSQIVGLELLAISLGLSTFEWWLKGKRVVIHSDNTGSECSVRCGVGFPCVVGRCDLAIVC